MKTKDTENDTEDKPMSPVEIVKGVTEVFGDKGISFKTDYVSTSFSQCNPEQCGWRAVSRIWRVHSGYNWPLRRWLAYDLWILVLFEHNGCDIHNARLVLSPKSFNKWYNDKAKFQFSAEGAASKLNGSSGCEQCCKASAIVDFDVSLAINYDFVKTDNMLWTVSIHGDGTVKIIKR
jgi:hypothetical protein